MPDQALCAGMPSGTQMPPELWLAGLLAAAPRTYPEWDPLGHIVWQRSLASLACSCKMLRRTLSSPEAQPLYREAAIVPHWHWKTWTPFQHRSCTLLAQSLQTRANFLTVLHLDCAKIQPGALSSLLKAAEHVTVLSLSGITATSAETLSAVFRAEALPSLRYLSCDGTYMPFAALPPLLTSLSCSLPRHGFKQPNPQRLCRSLAKLQHLQKLTLHLTGHEPFHMIQVEEYCRGECAALRLCYKVLHAFAAVPGHKLQLLTITQHLDHATCLSAASMTCSPVLIVEDLSVQRVHVAVDTRKMSLPSLRYVRIQFGMEAEDAIGLGWRDAMVPELVPDLERLSECDRPAAYRKLPYMIGSVEVGVSPGRGPGGRSSVASGHRTYRSVRPIWAPQLLMWSH